jgi:hypothetical protein
MKHGGRKCKQQEKRRAGGIFERGGVVRIADHHFEVESEAGKAPYVVRLTSCGDDCECGDCTFRHERCKHIIAAALQDEAERQGLLN